MNNKILEKFIDSGTERALISSIIKNGKDSYIDASVIVSAEDFYLPINRAIFTCIGKLSDDPSCTHLDIETIKTKAKALGIDNYFSGKKEQDYLEFLTESNFNNKNVEVFASEIRKLSIIRKLYQRYHNAIGYIEGIKGTENLSEILQKAEQEVIDFNLEVDNSDLIETLSSGMNEYIHQILNEPIVDQIGLSTGFPEWDKAIGGGLRRGTVNMIAARPKSGKTFHGLNLAINIAKKKIPVLYLDTELTKQFQQARLLGIVSQVPIKLIETRQVQKYPEMSKRLTDSDKLLGELPLFYKNISGIDYSEAFSFVRRWIVKNVGFREDGLANDCVLVYDYLKLTSGDGLAKHTPEYILIGLIMTQMHNFAVKYGIPILSYVQVNRQGIDNEDTSIIAQSDRILWLCSSLSVLRNKDQPDIEMGSSWTHGNKKLSVLETRFGAGLTNANDFINLHASLRPNVRDDEATGLITEGFKHSDVFQGYGNQPEVDEKSN